MANFVIVIDPDAPRRTAYRAAVRSRIAPLADLTLAECSGADFQAVWAAGPRAPVTHTAEGAAATVVWGTPMDDDGQRLTAAQVAERWRGGVRSLPPAFDGYFAAVTYDVRAGLAVGADLLGLFPIFWWQRGDVLLVGSSPELFRYHPLFRFELDLAGLTGILLLTHAVGGRTLMTGVRRLAAGHALVWRPGEAAREVIQYSLPVSRQYFDLLFRGAVELVYDTLRDAVDRHVPTGTPSTLTLTGGRDSRLLAGLMTDLRRDFVAVTLGDDGDIEMRCAGAVARALRLEHHAPRKWLAGLPSCPALNARWLHCTSGFSSSDYWHWHEDLRDLPPRLVTGYVMGSVIGGAQLEWVYSDVRRDASFANFFSRNNALGIEVSLLRSLLRPEVFGTALNDVLHTIRETYDGYSDSEAQRAWCFDLHHRQRFHVGTPPWQVSFGSWPIMPAVDKRVLSAVGGLPAGVMGEKRVQDEIILRWFPRLAQLPLDRNAYDTTPLSPRLRQRMGNYLLARTPGLSRATRGWSRRGTERRFYYRLLDFNGPAWRVARRQAEPHRAKLHALFNKDALEAIWPRPDVDVTFADGIIDGSSRRLLAGLSIWAGENL